MGVGRVVGGAAAGLGLVGAGYLGIGALDLDRDESGQITESGELGVFRIRLADCLNDAEVAGDVERVGSVPCTDPHDSEVYHAFNLADGAFPGDAAVSEQAEVGCLDAFQGFVGIPYEESELLISWYTPTRATWDSPDLNDREVLCTVRQESGQMSGSVAGAAR